MRARVVTVHSLDDRIQLISDKIEAGKKDPFVHQVVAEILTRKTTDGLWAVPEKNWEAEVVAIFDWMRNNVRYTRDVTGYDTYRAAKRTLQLGIGDCDDYTATMGAVLQAVGYPLRITVVGVDSKEPNHVYLRVGLPPQKPTRWPALDASVARPPGWEITQEPGARVLYRKDFNL